MYRRRKKTPIRNLTLFLSLSLIGIAGVRGHAVEIFKTSNFGDAKQIWFEAEAYDSRIPDTQDHYVLVNAEDAFGLGDLNAINRNGQAGGRISYTFDINTVDGEAGTWYFWGRVINPNNTSDFLLVEGHPGDEIPTDPPFAGTFTNAQRMFEQSQGPPWTWGRNPPAEGHIKELKAGENTMHIVHRQGADTIFWDTFMWTDSPNYVPTDEDYLASTVPIANPGDFNGDGVIDLADFIIMADNFGEKFPFAEAITKGDATGDTRVDLEDFIKVRALFNKPAGAAVSVPEPTGLALALVSLLVASFAIRRR